MGVTRYLSAMRAVRAVSKRQLWQWRGILIAVPLAVLSLGLLRSGGLLTTLELAALDQLFLMRPAEPPDDRIVLITIDEADIKAVGTWPMSDAQLAQLLTNVRQQQPRIIGLDLYRDLPVSPGEEQLQQVLEAATTTSPKIIGVQKLVSSGDSAAVAPPPILQQAAQVGANDFATEPDGSTRRVPLYLSLPKQPSLFSFSFILACQYLEQAEGKFCLQDPASAPDPVDQTVTVAGVPVPKLSPNSGGYQRDRTGGYFSLLNYRGPKVFSSADIQCRRSGDRSSQASQAPTFQAVCLADVLANQMPDGVEMRDRIVLIGPIAQSLNDLFYTPYSSRIWGQTRERMPGVVVHANAISQLLAAALENRPLLKTWSNPVEELWILAWAWVGASLSWQRGYVDSQRRPQRRRPGRLLVELGGLALLLGAGSYGLLLLGWWIPLVPALLALGGTAIAITAYIARTATEIRKIFGRYVTDQVVATLLENPEGLKIGGDRRKITILTSDLRGFTATSERLAPEAVVEILNLYLSAMTDVIETYGGTIDSFIGDGILVLFGAPTGAPDDASRAVACAVAMQQAMPPVNQQVQRLNASIALEMGIGLNTGEVVLGNIGSEKHTQYSVIGNHVNLAFRIEGFTVGGQILISAATLAEAGGAVQLGTSTQVQAKGVREPITVHEVLGVGEPFQLTVPQTDLGWVELSPPLPVQYVVVEGKQVAPEPVQAILTALSSQGAWLVCAAEPSQPLNLLDNVKLRFTGLPAAIGESEDLGELEELEELYAKVVERQVDRTGDRLRLRFTNPPARLKHWLDSYEGSG